MPSYKETLAKAKAASEAQEAALKAELAVKAEKEREQRQNDEERRRKTEDAARQARARELQQANANLRAAEPVKADQRLEYDPFAEVVLPKANPAKPDQNVKKITIEANGRVGLLGSSSPAAGKSISSALNGTVRPKPRSSSLTSSARPSKVEKKFSPPPLGRKERARQAFASTIKKSAKQRSILSVHQLLDEEEGYSSPPAAGPSRLGSRSPLPSHAGTKGPREIVTSLKPAKVAVDSRGLLKLRPEEGNRYKSLEAVQRDRSSASGNSGGLKAQGMDRTRSSFSLPGASAPLGKAARPKPPPVPSSARPAPTIGRSPLHRPRSPSSCSSASSESHHRHSKRYRSDSPAAREGIDVSAEIRAMFARPGRVPPRSGWISDEDGSDDMEAGLSEVEDEERRAARIARREDEKEEMEEKRRREEKARKKSGHAGGR